MLVIETWATMAEKSPGRELAIETLIDMEENGAFYRASRVLVRLGVIDYACGAVLFC